MRQRRFLDLRAVRLAHPRSITTADHCNTEHSQGEANLEIAGTTAAIKVHGFKAEGNYVQICEPHGRHQSRCCCPNAYDHSLPKRFCSEVCLLFVASRAAER